MCVQRMICGLAASIIIMIVEMTLFIVRAIQMEEGFENKNAKTKERGRSLASMDAVRAKFRPQLAAQTASEGGRAPFAGFGDSSSTSTSFSSSSTTSSNTVPINLMDLEDDEDWDGGPVPPLASSKPLPLSTKKSQ